MLETGVQRQTGECAGSHSKLTGRAQGRARFSDSQGAILTPVPKGILSSLRESLMSLPFITECRSVTNNLCVL